MPAKKRKTGVKSVSGLVRSPGEAEPHVRVRFPDAVEKKVGKLVYGLNRRLGTVGQLHEGIADELIDELFDGDAERALDPEGKLTPEYLCLRERAGRSFQLTPSELYTYVRVGAINRLRAEDGVWTGLEWPEKKALVPLLGRDDGHAAFNAAVQFAAEPNVGITHIQKWISDHTEKEPGTVGRPRGEVLTLKKGSDFAHTGVLLGNAKQREKFVEDLKSAPPEVRRELVRDLRKTQKFLAEVLDLVDEDDE